MKQYESIDYYTKFLGFQIIAFDKLDGSNLRFEYSQKNGFYKFGTRKIMIDETSEFGIGIKLFLDKYSEELTKVFKSKSYRDTQVFTCFAELIGTKSSFGQHDFENDTFDIVLFDIDQHKKGLIPPKQFIKDFGHLHIPRVIYEGNLNKTFVDDVKQNKFDLSEGVICKGQIPNKKNNNLVYCKIKTNDWFSRLGDKNIDDYNAEIKQYLTTL